MKQTVQPAARRTPKPAQPSTRVPAGSERQGGLSQLAVMADRSPVVQSLAQLRDDLQTSPRAETPVSLSSAPVQKKAAALQSAPLVVQRVLDLENVEEKAEEFLACHTEEERLIGAINTLLAGYSNEPSRQKLQIINRDLPRLRDEITVQTNLQADIIEEYAKCGVEAVRKSFLDTVLAKDATVMRPLFDKLLNQTTLNLGVDEKFKYRFLSYVLQSSKYVTGEGRFQELMNLLGDREVKINTRPWNAPLAGLEQAEDDPKSEKEDPRNKNVDKDLLEDSGRNLAEFVKAKRLLPDTRTENRDKGDIGNLQIDMDSSQKLLPVYFGLTGEKEVQAFTAPMHTAVHHELGHLVNRLKGKHGRKTDAYTPDEGLLYHLTDEEELQNISLDQYSDTAFNTELGLPERIAHRAFTSLDAQPQPFRESDLKGNLERWDQRTYRVDAQRLGLLQTIKSITGKSWGKYTTGIWFKPDGVKAIAKALETLPDTRKGVKDRLLQVQGLADTSFKKPSEDRKPTATEFYQLVAGIKYDSLQEIVETARDLEEFTDKWF